MKLCAFIQHIHNTLQHNATMAHFDTLQHTATHCNTMQHKDTQNMVGLNTEKKLLVTISLQHTAAHCNSLQLTATRCNTGKLTTWWALTRRRSCSLRSLSSANPRAISSRIWSSCSFMCCSSDALESCSVL